MSQPLRIATYNIEWFESLFDNQDELLLDDSRSARHEVSKRRQAEAIAEVLRAIDADLMLVVEAPDDGKRTSSEKALENFAAHFGLRQSRAMIGFPSDTQQELTLLYDPAILSARHDPKGTPLEEMQAAELAPEALLSEAGPAPRFDSVFALDIDGDGDIDFHRFSKPPVEAAATLRTTGETLHLIGVHAKSKAPHGAKDAEDAVRIAILNRRKQLAQCAWIRRRVEEHLADGDDLIVLGDFNDGPGIDKYERLFGRSGVEVVVGDPGDPDTLMRNPFSRVRPSKFGPRPSSARFYNRKKGGYLNALLDFVMLSPRLADRGRAEWRIWHPFDDDACFRDKKLQAALLDASDHFPVTVDLNFPEE